MDVFRCCILTPSVPRNDREFAMLVGGGWPRPVAPEKHPGTLRIIGLGDSFGVAGGRRNFHYLAEDRLRERGFAVEVANFSVPAYSPVEELEILRRFGERYYPDIVLHSFFVGNDFALSSGHTMRYRGIEVDSESGLRSLLPAKLLVLPWFLKYRRAREEQQQHQAEGGSGTFSADAFFWIEGIRMGTYRRPATGVPVWPAVAQALGLIKDECDRLGAVDVLVIHPAQVQVEPSHLREVETQFALQEQEFDVDLPLRFLHAWAAGSQVAVIDLTPALRSAGSGGGLYLGRDTHYNDAGNELAAGVIAAALEPLIAGPGGRQSGTVGR